MTTDDVSRVAAAREAATSGRAREIRVQRQLPIGEMANAVGVTPTTIWRWESGQVLPRGERAVRYATILAALEAGVAV